MKELLPWLAKAVFSALYWFGTLYLATGLFTGDRIDNGRVVERASVIPLWLFVVIVLAIYALCSVIWDWAINRRA